VRRAIYAGAWITCCSTASPTKMRTGSDYQYGRASVEQVDDYFRVLVFINMPVLQHNILAVSGFMACISAFFGLTYDGWGCVVQKRS
ncbi:hypothetical protein, partial [Burkholderia cenocepacia]|uniref:hypothetical protein n=1 Tax=Burkholderia cenocepacia TaxID=95486 RepID=UPI001C89280B